MMMSRVSVDMSRPYGRGVTSAMGCSPHREPRKIEGESHMHPDPSDSLSSSSSRASSDREPATGTLPDDENLASDLVETGSRIADSELRDAVTERYVDEANAGDDTEDALDEIDRAEAAADLAEEVGTGSDAIDFEVIPEE